MTGVLKLLWALSGGPVVFWRLRTGGCNDIDGVETEYRARREWRGRAGTWRLLVPQSTEQEGRESMSPPGG